MAQDAESDVEFRSGTSRRSPVDPAAGFVLRSLQQPAAMGPGGDVLAAAMRRVQNRAERRREVSERVAGELAEICVVGSVPEGWDTGSSGPAEADRDPRESASWFRELPQPEQARLRQVWSTTRHRFDHLGAAARRRYWRAACYGVGCFLASGLVMSLLFMNLMVLLPFVVVGPLAGVFAQLLGGGRFTYGLVGFLGFVVAIGGGIMNPLALYVLLFCMGTMAALGMDGEMRRSAGCRDD